MVKKDVKVQTERRQMGLAHEKYDKEMREKEEKQNDEWRRRASLYANGQEKGRNWSEIMEMNGEKRLLQ